MPLDKPALKDGIEQLLHDMRTRDTNSDSEYATRLSNLIEDFVKSGDGIYQTGGLQQSGATAVVASGPVAVKIQ